MDATVFQELDIFHRDRCSSNWAANHRTMKQKNDHVKEENMKHFVITEWGSDPILIFPG